ncbi:CoA pyrophosphatase [Neorhizobium galegae]|uniref:CoA pyrophosphatase n=1 Tax=Neorhizobium galegae TaxID=399 RepID=UPI000621FD0C|nr:CoA pyrophosphatase [Neorhizobium galegae]CDZ25291.1 NUDIX hydrolase [Neorhizobium galegae bv. officinalis]KAA9387840.1 CoA pyrophosphatase [Neorhizobium galegae]KAB1115689.1 CoA pyrophosphatase [Neorhizobium galegae]MCM2498232.1 CoA pyrophosphatase [Neorhizobium galegae]MCQ1765762.1 CoA pyrophosphatase [Neorhizobium galegae]
MSDFPLFSAGDFRRRALNQNGGPIDHAWRDHGDHLLNPTLVDFAAGLKLKDAAVLVPVVDDGDEAKVILTQRTSTMRKHSGQIAFPGGGIDPQDRSPEQAALREAEEEIGLDPSFVETLSRLPTYYAATGFRITPVLSVVRRGFEITPNPAEVDDVFEVPLSFLMNEANHQRGSREWDGKERHFYVMPYQERNIWGITAGILRTLYERLYA